MAKVTLPDHTAQKTSQWLETAIHWHFQRVPTTQLNKRYKISKLNKGIDRGENITNEFQCNKDSHQMVWKFCYTSSSIWVLDNAFVQLVSVSKNCLFQAAGDHNKLLEPYMQTPMLKTVEILLDDLSLSSCWFFNCEETDSCPHL